MGIENDKKSHNYLNKVYSVIKDSEWMEFTTGGIGSLTLVTPSPVQPWLILVSATLYLPHAMSNAQDRFKTMREAFHFKRYVDTVFWGGLTIKAIGGAFGNISRIVVGCLEIARLQTQTPVFNLIFNRITPIALLICSSIGALIETWATIRTVKQFRIFKREIAVRNFQCLDVLQVMHNASNLDKKGYIGTHFSGADKYESVRKNLLDLMEKVKQIKVPANVDDLSDRSRAFLAKHLHWQNANTPFSPEQDIQEAIYIYGEWIDKIKDPKIVEELKQKRAELQNDREHLIHLMQSEFHRRLLNHGVGFFLALLGITSGSLAASLFFATSTDIRVVASALALAAITLDMGYIVFTKKVSQEKFLKWDKKLFPQYFALATDKPRSLDPGQVSWWWESSEKPDLNPAQT